MSAQNSKGIQTLLDAEREAQKIVQKAREYRSKRVKDAKQEAQKRSTNTGIKKDDEFQKFEDKYTSGNKQAEEDAKKDADRQISEIKKVQQSKGDQVVKDLLKAVADVQLEVPDRIKEQKVES